MAYLLWKSRHFEELKGGQVKEDDSDEDKKPQKHFSCYKPKLDESQMTGPKKDFK